MYEYDMERLDHWLIRHLVVPSLWSPPLAVQHLFKQKSM